MLWTWHEATVTAVEQLTANTRSFRLCVNDAAVFDFNPGQFVTFDLPISEKRLQRWRSYSIASSPDGTAHFELCIARVAGGAGTRYFFEDVTVGTVLKFKGADGVFVLPKTLDAPLTMICTGTGVAPFRAMLRHVLTQKIPHQALHLVFGTRHAADILYENEWVAFAKQHADFSFSIALSREETSTYTRGYVHEVYTKNIAEHIAKNGYYFICGWKPMIDDTLKILAEAGVPREKIHYELYG